MASFASQISFPLLFLLFATTFNRVISCNENDQRLLLIFKQEVVDTENQLSSWTAEEDCCLWEGVHCDNITGRVTELSLSTTYALEGDINLCVLQLEFLNYLDLSGNDFKAVSMPPCQISKSPFDAHKFHNQSLGTPSNHSTSFSVALRYLNFSHNLDLVINDLHWLSQLSSLKYLDLSDSDIGKDTKWLQHIAMLPSLSELHLRYCGFRDLPSIDYANFTSLEVLVLSENVNMMKLKLPNSFFNITNHIYYLDLYECNFYGPLPKSLLNLQNLKHLDLGYNNFKGLIPHWLGQYEQLQRLDIRGNFFYGVIPLSLGNISSLFYLDLSYNQLNGNLPETLGQLHSLNQLDIGHNFLVGVLTEKTFSNFSNLTSLGLHSTSFEFDIDPKWVPPFQLEALYLGNTSIGPNVPSWLYTQRSLTTLDISTSGISKIDADIFWSFVVGIDYVDISNNLISDDISNVSLSANMSSLVASHNSLSGSIFSVLCQLENNGESKLSELDLSYNHLSGALPDCSVNQKQLLFLILGSNKLTGEIVVFAKGRELDYKDFIGMHSIDLSTNNLSGEIPKELFNLVQLWSLNLSQNHLIGKIPEQIGGMKNLESLDLSYNKLSGEIPSTICNLSFLDYLNLSYNNFTGQIPLGTQIQSFDPWSFVGNDLCGDPLPKKCYKKEASNDSKPAKRNEDDEFLKSLYLGMGVGFAAGFWAVCGSLFLIRAWRHKFFHLFQLLVDRLYVIVALKLKKASDEY
ncbi:receptor-like protein EIX1 [Neltuma alba]|uniref:receptor-like protein EIX1 n=1 Tax=Neltuma alba TaxID=207710 RepID=UPI0010A46062|nr:receptor-like protein EIX1 [Prosopis alba]